jgi:hypothetical protein
LILIFSRYNYQKKKNRHKRKKGFTWIFQFPFNSSIEKKALPVSKPDFLKQAKPIKISIDGNEFTADPKEFSSGSFGWSLAGKPWVPAHLLTQYNRKSSKSKSWK